MDSKEFSYQKILNNIEGSLNALHIQTCVVMIGFFKMKFDDDDMELDLKLKLDERMNKIGLVTL